MSLCLVECHSLLMSLQGGVFPSKGVCPCASHRAPFIVHPAQSGHRGSLAGRGLGAEGRALGRWCECQGPPTLWVPGFYSLVPGTKLTGSSHGAGVMVFPPSPV